MARTPRDHAGGGPVVNRISRRRFLGVVAGAGAATAVGVPFARGIAGATSTGLLLPSRIPLPRAFTVPFAVPPVLQPIAQHGSTVEYDMVQRAARVEILPGLRTTVWGYQGLFPGPTIHARRGQHVKVHQRNQLPVPAVVHLHGARTPHGSDGYPTDLITPPGWMMPKPNGMMPADPHADVTVGERTYEYPIDQQAATLWYHDHRMGFTGASVWRGLAGFFIIHDDAEDALGLPAGLRDWPLMIADRSFDADGSFRYPSLDPHLYATPGVTSGYSGGVLGDVILVNGRPWPLAKVDGARYRLRILNASNARRYRLALDPPPPGGAAFVQIGSDGGLLPVPITHDGIEIAQAERFDVIVDFSRYNPGQRVVLRNDFGAGRTEQVMQFVVGPRAEDPSRVPDKLATVQPISPAAASTTRSFWFANMGPKSGWQINGHLFDPAYANATVPLGATEVWRLVTDMHHPIHLHAAQFQVLSRAGKASGPYDHGWKDVIDLRPAEEVTIAARFTGYRGRYVFHCHNLEHEDMAMMGNLVIT